MTVDAFAAPSGARNATLADLAGLLRDLGAAGRTIAVLASGPDFPYPLANRGLLADVASHGAVVSEWPPGTLPGRQRFLLRNRIIAALSCGTVVAEAARRGGTMATARRAADLGRPLMAVPGPVTSGMPAGCHALLREGQAACVTSAEDITACLRPPCHSQEERPSGCAGAAGQDVVA